MVSRYKHQKAADSELMQLAIEQLAGFRPGDLPELDALVKVMASIFKSPIVSVSMQYEDNLVFPATEGGHFSTLPQEHSFSRQVFETGKQVVVEDAHQHPVFSKSEVVIKPPYLCFYAGEPLRLDGDRVIGTVAILDYKPRTISAEELRQLELLSRAIEGLLRSQLNLLKAEIALKESQELSYISDRKGRLLEEVANVSGVGGWELDVDTGELFWTEKTRELHAVPDDFIPTLEKAYEFYPPEARQMVEKAVEDGLKQNGIWNVEVPFCDGKGRHLWVNATGQAVNENGKLKRLIGAFQDVSARRLMESRMLQGELMARQKSEELLAIITNLK